MVTQKNNKESSLMSPEKASGTVGGGVILTSEDKYKNLSLCGFLSVTNALLILLPLEYTNQSS